MMTRRKLTIWCPEMGVTNTGYWWQTTADRITDNLPCKGLIGDEIPFDITFPPCIVKFISKGHWIVEQVVATGKLYSGQKLQITYPPELVHRQGLYLYAEEVGSIDRDATGRLVSYLEMANGALMPIESTLPLAKSSPVGLGLKKYIVEAVVLPGSVMWPS